MNIKLIANRDFQSTIIGSVSKGDNLAGRISNGYAKALIEAGVVDASEPTLADMCAAIADANQAPADDAHAGPTVDQGAEDPPADQGAAEQAPAAAAKPGRKPKAKAE